MRSAREGAAREALVLELRRNEETERARQRTFACVAEAAVSPAPGAAERPEPMSSESTAASSRADSAAVSQEGLDAADCPQLSHALPLGAVVPGVSQIRGDTQRALSVGAVVEDSRLCDFSERLRAKRIASLL